MEPLPCVSGNRWDLLDPPVIGAWEPHMRVTVVVPAFGGQPDLDRVLAGLANQTYPSALLEIVVADDGSDPPIAVPTGVELARQAHDGFGLASARNLGARQAGGEILIFLDADMVPERQFVEAHARWHHMHADALVMGFRRHTELGHLGVEHVGELVASDAISATAMEHDLGVPEWLEAHFRRTDDATQNVADLFRFVTGGNFSIQAADYQFLGGTSDTFREYGGEDRELAFRAQVDGMLFVPERRAFAWHQGPGGWQADDIDVRKAEADRRLALYIADQSVRPSGTVVEGRPMVTVVADGVESAGQVNNMLSNSEFRDFEIVASPEAGWTFSPIRLSIAEGLDLGPASLAKVVGLIRNPQLGRLEVLVDDEPVAVAILRRAQRRSERCGVNLGDLDTVGFGSKRISGAEVGISKGGP